MTETATTKDNWSAAKLEARVVRYTDLIPCLNAFIDTRTPGSEAKENFTIIGAGVSENPEQHVHIGEPHGFNIGGARQPPLCVNSQHSHDTAEVFVVHSGRWRFDFGENADDASVEAGPGDLVSFPIHCFRGFTNIGEEIGFLWSVLGGDDPGRVTWAPRVFELAENYGLVLLENGSLIDRGAGEATPAGIAPMPVTTREQIAAMRVMSSGDADEVLARASAMKERGETLVIGPDAMLPPTDGFTVRRIVLAPDETINGSAEVIFVQDGAIEVQASDASVALGAGDTMTIPADFAPTYTSAEGATLFIVRRAR